jgi:hypothetical protein
MICVARCGEIVLRVARYVLRVECRILQNPQLVPRIQTSQRAHLDIRPSKRVTRNTQLVTRML